MSFGCDWLYGQIRPDLRPDLTCVIDPPGLTAMGQTHQSE